MSTSKPEYGIVVSKNVMVPMRDGVRLATDLYRPASDGDPAPGRFPAILGRTSYDKESTWLWVKQVAEYFTPRGYVVAIQDLRGRHSSEGTGQYFHVANPGDGDDGHDTIEWIAAQPWSNGRVGMTGSSHGALTQQTAALRRPPHLTTIWPDAAPINSYAHQSREGGAMKLMMFGALFLHAQDAQEIRNDPVGRRVIEDAMVNMRSLVVQQPFKPGHTPLHVVPNLEKTLFDYYYRGEYDEFWALDCNDQERHFHLHADIPAVFSGGWFDAFATATTRYFAAMADKNSSYQRLVMGPWTHYSIFQGFTHAGEVEFGPESAWGAERYNAERLRWFDRWLKDVPNGVEDEPPVLIYVMGGGSGHRTPEGRLFHGGEWRAENGWPLARTEYTRFYLRGGGGLGTEPPGPDDAPASYTFDPEHPVPTISSTTTGFFEVVPLLEGINEYFARYVPLSVRMRSIVNVGGAHQKEEPGIVGARPPYPLLASRPDVLVFETPPLDDDVEVTGPISARLWISSSAVDTDFTMKLLDVYPPTEDWPEGFALGLVDSIIRTRYRSSWSEPELMKPGGVYEVELTLPPTSNLFNAGHRIRVDVSSSNFPLYDVNPNTGEPVGRHTRMIPAYNTVYLDAARSSQIVLPIIPR